MNIRRHSLLCLLTLLAGCSKEKIVELVEPEPDPIVVNCYSDSNDDGSGDKNSNENDENDENTNIVQNLLINGGLEKWIPLTSYDMPDSWLCHNNYNVRKNHTIVYEGNWSAKMKSLEKGSTATIDQCVQITPNHKIRIRFHYFIEEWKDKGARTYCYFRTRSAEVSTIPANELEAFYDEPTYRIIRGGGYGLTYFPHELNKWLTFDETIEVPPIATYFVFGINSYFGTTIYVDDCWVIDVNS